MNTSQFDRAVADLHCHYYPCFDPSKYFDYASNNLSQISPTETDDKISARSLRCLFLADLQWRTPDQFFKLFDHLTGFAATKNINEINSYTVALQNATPISVIFGYQLISREKLEILVYGLDSPLPDDLPAATITEMALDKGALVILPWGFGKWWFGRGQKIESMISSGTHQTGVNRFYVGDNGGRWRNSKVPSQIRSAATRNIWNLPGSDPLPYSSEVERVGGMGAVIRGNFSAEKPLQTIQAALSSTDTTPDLYGHGASISKVVKLQLAMQIRKQFRSFTRK